MRVRRHVFEPVGTDHKDGEQEERERSVRDDGSEFRRERDACKLGPKAEEHPRASKDLNDAGPIDIDARRKGRVVETPRLVWRSDVLKALSLREMRDAGREIDEAKQWPRRSREVPKERVAKRVEDGTTEHRRAKTHSRQHGNDERRLQRLRQLIDARRRGQLAARPNPAHDRLTTWLRLLHYELWPHTMRMQRSSRRDGCMVRRARTGQEQDGEHSRTPDRRPLLGGVRLRGIAAPSSETVVWCAAACSCVL